MVFVCAAHPRPPPTGRGILCTFGGMHTRGVCVHVGHVCVITGSGVLGLLHPAGPRESHTMNTGAEWEGEGGVICAAHPPATATRTEILDVRHVQVCVCTWDAHPGERDCVQLVHPMDAHDWSCLGLILFAHRKFLAAAGFG